MHTKFWSEYLREETLGRPKRRWEDNIRMDLIEICRNMWTTGFTWLRTGPATDLCEDGDEPSGSIKGG
jgi:hypothetical protein